VVAVTRSQWNHQPHPHTCLVVDDEPIVRLGLKVTLENLCAVRLAEDGEQALEILKQEPIHVVLLDLILPGMNGIEVLRRIRQTRPYLPVILLTGYGTFDVLKQAVSLQVTGYIEKPFDFEELKERVNAVLSRVTISGICPAGWFTQNTHDLFEAIQRLILARYDEPLTVEKIAEQFGSDRDHSVHGRSSRFFIEP